MLDLVYPECHVDIGGQTLNVDLIQIRMTDFDVILGMN